MKTIALLLLAAALFSSPAHAFLHHGVGGGSQFSLPGSPKAVYSTRKIVAAYSGSAVNVSRASDNTTTDIGFSGTDFNIAAFNSFCAGTFCYVTEWYDQSGGGFNAVQATGSMQPPIIVIGSRAYVTFGHDFQNLNVAGTVSSSTMTVGYTVLAGSDFAEIPVVDLGSGWFSEVNNQGGGTTNTVGNSPGSFNLWATGFTTDASNLYAQSPNRVLFTANSGAEAVYVNGAQTNTATGAVISPAANGFTIGNYSSSFQFEGAISEIFVYDSVLSSGNRAAIDAAQAIYWPNLGFQMPYIAGNNSVQFSFSESLSAGNTNEFERTQPWTAWGAVQMYTVPNTASIIFTNVANTSAFPGYELWIGPNCKLVVRIISDISTSNYLEVDGSTSICDGNKHMVSTSYDGSSTASGVHLYVDGVPETMTTAADGLTSSIVAAGQLFLVGNQQGFDFGMRGTIGLFQLDNVVRNSAYVAAHSTSASLPPIDANTVLSYHFTEGSGTTVHDGSASGFTGTLSSGAMWVASAANNVQFALPTGDTLKFMDPAGNDSCNGTSATLGSSGNCAWASPNHAVHCGDVIVAAKSTAYPNDMSTWGTVSNCPSTTGGIDGTGGIHMAVLLCGGTDLSTANGCVVNCAGASPCNIPGFGPPAGIAITQSHWAVEGWTVTCGTSLSTGGGCEALVAEGAGIGCASGGTIEQAFINDVTYNDGQGFETLSCNSANGPDYVAVVGSIFQNAIQWNYNNNGHLCSGAVDIIAPGKSNSTTTDTHFFMYNNFSYNNLETSCDAHFDGEDFLVDTPDFNGVVGHIVWSNNVGFFASRNCFNFTYGGGTGGSTIKLYNNTCTEDNQRDTAFAGGNEAEVLQTQNGGSPPALWTFDMFNNISYSPYATNPQVGSDVLYALQTEASTANNIGNGFRTGAESIVRGTPSPGQDANGPNTTGTNTSALPSFANVTDLLANQLGVPVLTGFINTTQAMGYSPSTSTLTTPSIISDLQPSCSNCGGVGFQVANAKGFQIPSTACLSSGDIVTDYPPFLKGIVYLHWNGASITENADLVTKPCGL